MSESEPGSINPFLERIKSVDVEAQLTDSIEWEVGLARSGQGRYEVMIVGSGEIVIEVPLAGKVPLVVRATAILGVDADTLDVVEYRVASVSVEGSES